MEGHFHLSFDVELPRVDLQGWLRRRAKGDRSDGAAALAQRARLRLDPDATPSATAPPTPTEHLGLD